MKKSGKTKSGWTEQRKKKFMKTIGDDDLSSELFAALGGVEGLQPDAKEAAKGILNQRRVSERRNAAIKAGFYKDVRGSIPEETKRILLICPPKLLEDFQQLCDQESYALVEGIREAMRQFIWAHRPDDYESPEAQNQNLQRFMSTLQDMAKMQSDPSTLPSQQKNTL